MASAPPPILTLSGITKSFPGVRALDGVDLEVLPGEVHCLLGQNGAGKSTLIKVVAGAHQPDTGEITWQGERVALSNPVSAMRLGISTIYQELDLVLHLSVAENVHLGHERATAGFVRRGEARTRTSELLARLGHPEIHPDTIVGDLSSAGQQIVSMARALSHDTRLIVMDEPSAVLDPDEVGNLFRIVENLTADNVAVVYISHRLEEIRRIGDRVTVLKDGRAVARGLPAKETATKDIVALMTGRDVEYSFPRRAAPFDSAADEPVLVAEALTRAGEFDPLDLEIRPGEIVGLAGLVGSGRSEILETLYGARTPTGGTVRVEGKRLRPGSVISAVRAGLGLAPEERKAQALFMLESVTRNVSISSLPRFSRGGWLDRSGERDAAHSNIKELSLRPDNPDAAIRTLSGGNQQKAVLARWLLRRCKVLLLDEPTRGVDVGARAELYTLIRRLADDGVAVLLVSSEIPEVLGLADRVLVLREGQVVHTAPARELDEHRVLDLVMEGSQA
ncbi:monosaccharide ABC transporter ATP-binding protein, CUT2 family [Streptomyces zhaozhouensis]|uniref:Monosaccharide ABC transporter ATP-binding protein, CUT2 family n=1 Tax=Streptomyces zhaozhouensis TaxID=1300267 RepID=A0A286DV04_9ACTN|nr:sugar ABC transporter ATP-binding protein [Streptomyces zhaozhouensis]SOD62394.1 monosaccharide ABC transporter ATP-binding protein, CUT2 family [Streptomyces zhaozhouensis]